MTSNRPAPVSSGSDCTNRANGSWEDWPNWLKLHPLAVEDAVVAHQRPKLERYDNSLFAVVKTVHYNDDGHQITGSCRDRRGGHDLPG